jgi:ectoine utilization protein EutC
MGTITVLTRDQIEEAVGLGREELAAIEAVYPIISAGRAQMPPIMCLMIPEHDGEIDIKSAFLPGYEGIAVKVSIGFFHNPKRGLPSLSGMMMLFDAQTGVPLAALFDQGYLTNIRTALAGAVAADHLAVPDASTVALVGAGMQARLQLEALRLVRPIEEALVWTRDPEEAAAFAERVTEELDLPVTAAPTVPDAAARADILVTATPSSEPLVHLDAIHPGLHITSVGADSDHKQEIDAEVVRAADVVAVDHRGQSSRLGELRSAIAAGFDVDQAVELGQIISGEVAGRPGPEAVTHCDLTGTGAQDTAIASLAVRRCLDAGAGLRVEV